MVAEGTATYTYSGSSGGGETQSGSGSLRFLPSGPDARTFDADVTVTSPTTGRMRAVLLPGAVYLALPPAKGLPRSKPWLKVSATAQDALGRQLTPVAEQMRTAFDPGQGLGLLRAAGPVAEVGPATVEGVPTTQHRATIEPAQGQPAGRGRGDPRAVPGDAGGRRPDPAVRAVAGHQTGCRARSSAAVPTTQGLFSVTGVYRAWGEPVKINAPGPKQVYDADSIKG